jgi:hypothetical protein
MSATYTPSQIGAGAPPSGGGETFDPMNIGAEIKKATVVLEFHVHTPGFRKPLPPSQVVKDAIANAAQQISGDSQMTLEMDGLEAAEPKPVLDPDMLYMSQDIIVKTCSEWKAIADCYRPFRKAMNECRIKYARTKMLLPGGHHLIPLERVGQMHMAIETYITDRKKAVETFIGAIDRLDEEARMLRGEFYSPTDIPSPDEIRHAFRVEYKWKSDDVPATLATVSPALLEAERKKHSIEWADTATEIRKGLRQMSNVVLNGFAEMLSPDDASDGKKKTFKTARFKKLIQFAEEFEEAAKIGLTKDDELAAVVSQIRQLTEGLDPDLIKKNDDIRKMVETRTKQILSDAARLVETEERTFLVEEEEVATV